MGAGPTFMTFRGPLRIPRRLRHVFTGGGLALTVLVIGIAVLITLRIEELDLREERELTNQRLQQLGDSLTERIQREVMYHEVTAIAVASAIRNNPFMSQIEFANVVSPLIEGHPSIINVAAAPDLVVRNVYPRAGNESVIGLDYRDLPDQIRAIDEARDSGRMVFSGPVDLIQGGVGFIERAPVFTRDIFGERRFWGIVSIVSDRDEIVSLLGFDELEGEAQAAVRLQGVPGLGPETVWGDRRVFAQRPVIAEAEFGAGHWQVALIPEGGWPGVSGDQILIRAGMALATLITLLVMHSIRYLHYQRRRAERQLHHAIEALDDGFALFDPEDRLVMCNQRYREMYAASADAIVEGVPFEELLRAGIRHGQYADAAGREEEWLEHRLAMHRNPGIPIEQKLDDGRWLKISEARTEDGSTVGFRVDITELKIARETAERASSAKTDFLNVVSHELRTPLTAILGYSTILSNLERLPAYNRLVTAAQAGEPTCDAVTDFVGAVQTYSNRIDCAGQDLLAMINDILYWSKSQAKDVEMKSGPVPLDTLISGALSKLSGSAARKNITLTGDGGHLIVTGDHERLTQVLVNMIGNAIKFTSEGGVEVLAASSGHDHVEIAIRDTGCGIAEEHFDRIFDRFTQADNSLTRAQNGAGLGLSISRDIVRLHGGTIRVESRLGEGSVFRILLQRHHAQELAA
ncbi:PAS domain-containing protein [Aquicoccus sp. SCR17]|nr:PAS domain-containing protein [Carideicomes alvinocaridis]